MKLRLEMTKKGFPAIWESGGGATNTGHSQIVAGSRGERLTPIYVKRSGPLSQGDHALFIVSPGMLIVEDEHHRGDFTRQIWRVKEIVKRDCDRIHTVATDPCYICEGHNFFYVAILEMVTEFSRGEWSVEPPQYLEAAIKAAFDKATCYHCRSPHYVKEA